MAVDRMRAALAAALGDIAFRCHRRRVKHRSSRLSFRLASLFSSSAAACVGKPLGSTRMVAAASAGSQEGPKFDVDFTTSNTRSSVTATEQLVDSQDRLLTSHKYRYQKRRQPATGELWAQMGSDASNRSGANARCLLTVLVVAQAFLTIAFLAYVHETQFIKGDYGVVYRAQTRLK
jgi:hypothetical protein